MLTCLRLLTALLFFLALICAIDEVHAADKAAASDLFENNVRPLLMRHCIECHGPAKQESGLRLDSHEHLLQGGDRGAALVPGKPTESLLLTAIQHAGDLEMPPKEARLADEEIAPLVRWIEQGSPWPRGVTLARDTLKLRGGPITDEERAFWSFQPLAEVKPPAVKDKSWPNGDVDRFVLAKLEQAGMVPAADADKRTLLRRVTFDLTGLPPTSEEVQVFLADDSPEAFAKVVDRLLASSAYGERWGRHWLDLVRYADTAGETADFPVREAYKYRDYVIASFNADKPYDAFIREQVAGDLLAAEFAQQHGDDWDDASLARYEELVTATGYLAISRRFGFDPQNYQHLTIQDTIDTLGQSFLGLSIGCARCHDHKFDPINRQDYYALYGMFDSTRYAFPGSEERKAPSDFLSALPPKVAAERQGIFDAKVEQLKKEIKAGGDQKAENEAELSMLQTSGPYEVLYAVSDAKPHDVPIQLRGEPQNLGEVAPRRWLEILGGDPLDSPENGSGRRQLADWLTQVNNPMTARVMVNRIWQHHFGEGLVRTANDFGRRGQQPTHSELLDWLATRFIESGWSNKEMHRLIVNSRTYRMACRENPEYAQRDPKNEFLWQFTRRRLSAEEIRDALLYVGGTLDRSPAGPHPFPPTTAWNFTQHQPFDAIYASSHRSIYLMTSRLKRHPFLALFDGADPNATTPQRRTSTVPTQALFLMNSPLVHEQSAALAKKLAQADANDAGRIQQAWMRTLSRPASDVEVNRALEFLENYRRQLEAEQVAGEQRETSAWAALCRTLMTRNEFLFVE